LKADPDDSPPILSSLALLGLAVLSLAVFAIHTILSRRRYRRFFEEDVRDWPWIADFFMTTPAPVYGAAFLLLAVALLLKEVAVESKRATFRINLAALLGTGALWLSWRWTVAGPVEQLLEDLP
jgi:hypothetical protein